MNYKRVLTFVGLFATLSTAGAQELQTGFFLDNYAYSHRINPALQASRDDVSGYFGAGADNLVISAHSNVGLNNFLFPTEDGQLVIGLDDYVSDDEFLSGLSPVNSIRVDANENLFSIGGKGKRGTHFNFEVNLKSDNNVNVSKDVFTLLKQGGNVSDMQFSDFSVASKNYLEASLGFAKKCGNLSVGFKVKGLLGIAAGNASVNKLSVTSGDGGIRAEGNGEIRLAAGPVELFDADGNFTTPSLNMSSLRKFDFSGMGVAFDLGFAYTPTDKLEISASLIDLGVFTWDYGTDGQLKLDYDENLHLQLVGSEESSKMQALPIKANAGLRYSLNNTFALGALLSAETGNNTFLEARGGLTCTAGSILSIAATGGVNSFGPVYGAALNLCAGPVSLFAGLDQIITTFTPQWIPVGKVNTNAALGLVVCW